MPRIILTIIVSLAALAIQVAHAETPSTVLQSLPPEVQKNIEQVRTSCRDYFTGFGVDPGQSFGYVSPRVSSGDEGLISFTVSGAQAVIVSDLHLCGDQCIKGITCSTAGGSSFDIYVRTGNAWRNVLSTTAYGQPFLSLDYGGQAFKFKAMVLAISGASKECPKRRIFLRTYGPTAWKRPCDVIVRWNGAKFTYEGL